MSTIRIKGIEYIFDLSPGNIYSISIENPYELYNKCKMILLMQENDIVIYDGKILDNKYILPIFDLLNIDANSKKNLNATYKDINMNCKSGEIKDMLNNINCLIVTLLDYISQEMDTSMSFSTDYNLPDLLNIYSFKYEFDNESFLSSFITFLKCSLLANKYRVVFTRNITDFLSNEDLHLLKKELSYMNLTLIDINGKKSLLNFDKSIIIDSDLCEI